MNQFDMERYRQFAAAEATLGMGQGMAKGDAGAAGMAGATLAAGLGMGAGMHLGGSVAAAATGGAARAGVAVAANGCAKCGGVNPATARFCSSCGQALV
jgi:membrane protease subunit (stomatin/prohibitin family)